MKRGKEAGDALRKLQSNCVDKRGFQIVAVGGLGVSLVLVCCILSGCEYARLTRPKALKQLTPDMVRLVNELPEVDRPNEKIVARLFAHGGLDHAKQGADGVYRLNVRVPEGQYIWNPAIIVMEKGGELELEFKNEDSFSYHAAYIQHNGGRQTVTLPVRERGKLKVQLDGPGLYWFGCPVSNHATRGMLGMIIVGGDVPAEARLDRPKNPNGHVQSASRETVRAGLTAFVEEARVQELIVASAIFDHAARLHSYELLAALME